MESIGEVSAHFGHFSVGSDLAFGEHFSAAMGIHIENDPTKKAGK